MTMLLTTNWFGEIMPSHLGGQAPPISDSTDMPEPLISTEIAITEVPSLEVHLMIVAGIVIVVGIVAFIFLRRRKK